MIISPVLDWLAGGTFKVAAGCEGGVGCCTGAGGGGGVGVVTVVEA
ncbi:MAG: hypothetical protein ABSB31_11030 [Dehalococcoidia bacterium]